MEKHYYDPGTMINAKAKSKIGCWQLIRNECVRLGHPVPTLYDLVEVVVPDNDVEPFGGRLTWDDYTPWKEFSPDMLKDGAELLIRISGGEHIHVHVAEVEPKVVLRSAWNDEIVHIVPLREITHAFVINPVKDQQL